MLRLVQRSVYSGYPDLREVWNKPKVAILYIKSLLSYSDVREYISQLGYSAENMIFHHEGQPSRKCVGVELSLIHI